MTRRRLFHSPLLLLVALLTGLAYNLSSATASTGPETRVRAIDTPTAIHVEAETNETPASVGRLRLPQPVFVSATGVATNTVDTSIFRGVATDHHAYDDAVRGIARPGDVNGVSDVALHNAGFTHGTDLTSWSTRLSTAEDFAGPGGVVLETTVGSLQRRGIQILTSPDAFNEAEILVKGAFGGLRIR